MKKRSAKRAGVERKDAAWAAKIKAPAGCQEARQCALCLQLATDAHHVFGKKSHPTLRYDLDNGIALCRYHHRVAHSKPRWFRERFAHWYPDRWARLEAARLA